MLYDVKIDPIFKDSVQRLGTGIYQTTGFNFELQFRGSQIYDLDYSVLPNGFSSYGVCDDPFQLRQLLPYSVREGFDSKYVISLTEIVKKDEPPKDGWRWEKWGLYIGSQESKADYLYDEPEIEAIWVYHIYLLREEDLK